MRLWQQPAIFPTGMNAPAQTAKLRRNGRNIVLTVPKGFAVEHAAGVYRVDGREIVLRPVGDQPPIPPGSYTPETLPPLSEGARKILASIDAVAPLVDVRSNSKSAHSEEGIEIEDEGVGIELDDEGLPGIDPGD